MSKYFHTLKRLEQDMARDSAIPLDVPNRSDSNGSLLAASAKETVVEPVAPVSTPAVHDGRTVGQFAVLLDNLRVLGNGVPVGTVVIAGASRVENVNRTAVGLAAEVTRHGLRVVVGELYRAVNQPLLRLRMASTVDQRSAPHLQAAERLERSRSDVVLPAASVELDLRSGPVPKALMSWLETARKDHDMVIIEAPPLGLSVDAAMIARACEGLILVVEPRVTPREALAESVERAEGVGCRLLGLVLQGRPEWIPPWLRPLITKRGLF